MVCIGRDANVVSDNLGMAYFHEPASREKDN